MLGETFKSILEFDTLRTHSRNNFHFAVNRIIIMKDIIGNIGTYYSLEQFKNYYLSYANVDVNYDESNDTSSAFQLNGVRI